MFEIHYAHWERNTRITYVIYIECIINFTNGLRLKYWTYDFIIICSRYVSRKFTIIIVIINVNYYSYYYYIINYLNYDKHVIMHPYDFIVY